MAENSTSAQEAEWGILHDRITAVLDRIGRKDGFRNGDYWLVDENWGWRRQQVEIQNLAFLDRQIVQTLQNLLADLSNWTIAIRVDVPGTEQTWPPMGLIIRHDEIVDQLQRIYLPDEFRSVKYGRDG